jgi:Fe-S-cluster containining protein
MPLSRVDIHFECTRCARCCRDSRLPLTVAEALVWLDDGRDLQVLCDATPWPEEPPNDDAQGQYRRQRSFAAMSGSLPVRIAVILAANLAGACPNLGPDDLCRIHARRPLVCRIYPAEVNPFVALVPANKACPAEAWAKNLPLLQRDGKLMDSRRIDDLRSLRDASAADVGAKQRLCARLGISDAALANEGLCATTVDRETLLRELRLAAAQASAQSPALGWRLVSDRANTISALSTVEARCEFARNVGRADFEYLSMRRVTAGADSRQP